MRELSPTGSHAPVEPVSDMRLTATSAAPTDEGGDAPCWAHLLDTDQTGARSDDTTSTGQAC